MSAPRSDPVPPSSASGKPPLIGSRVAGRYRVVALLHDDGSDHSRVAVDERHPGSRRLVVLETLRHEQRPASGAIEAFVHDARLRERMSHPNLVQTHELVEHEGLPVLVTEYVEGESLATLLALAYGLPEFSLEVRLTILAHALRGLAYIHQLGALAPQPLRLVHASVSPHDIVVGYDGSVKLSGYGSAAGGARRRSKAALAPANIEYLAPERLHGSMLPSSDVFSAGVLLWELVALQRFWNHLPEYEVRRRLLAFDIPEIARSRPQVAGELGRICRQALAPDPARRHASGVELASDLERFLVERSALAAPGAIAGLMKIACGALQQEAQRVLDGSLDSALHAAAARGQRQSLTDAGIWQLLTRERPLPSSTTAAWAAGTLAALLIALAAQQLRSPAPETSGGQPVSLEPVSLEPASREMPSRERALLEMPSLEPASREAPSREVPSLDAVRPAIPPAASLRAGEPAALAAPEHRSPTTTIQTLLPAPRPRRAAATARIERERSEPVLERRKAVDAEARARRARRPGEATPMHAPDAASATAGAPSQLTIRLER